MSRRALALHDVVRRQITIRGFHNYAPRHLLEGIEFLAANYRRFPFAELVARWLPLEQVAEAFRFAGQPELIRVGTGPAERALS